MATVQQPSEVSIGFSDGAPGEQTNKPCLPEQADLLDNVLCLLMYCKTHRRVVIKRTDKGLFLPYRSFRTNESWRKIATTFINRILERLGSEPNCGNGHCNEPQMFDIFRVQCPKTRQFYTRLTILVRMIADGESAVHKKGASRKKGKPKGDSAKSGFAAGMKCFCRVTTTTMTWMGAEELANNDTKFWGPEVSLFYGQLQESDKVKFELTKNYADCSVRDALRQLIERARNSKARKNQDMLRAGKFNKQAAVRLLNGFIYHCYPSRYLNYNSFKELMCKLSDNKQTEDYPQIYKAFNFTRTNYLSFEELLFGLVAMDMATPHSGTSLEVRLGYIFRYFDLNSDKTLNLAELSALNSDLITKNKDMDLVNVSGDVAKMTSNYFTSFISRFAEAQINEEQFIAMVTANKTVCQLSSLLLRSQSNCLLAIASKFDYGSTSIYVNRSALASISLQMRYSKPCQICRCIRFHILADAARISLNGEVSRLINLSLEQESPDWQPSEASRDTIPFVMEIKREDTADLALLILNKLTSLGKQVFSLQGDPSDEAARLWYFASASQLGDSIKKILSASKARLQQENKIIAVSSPCYVIGGLYGNLKDLLIFGHLLWKTAPRLNKVTFVFLGNLVGTQPWNLECLIYVLCLQILTPQRFIILRGIQEMGDSQKQIFRECQDRFGNAEIGHLVKDIFDQLPLGAIIEGKIFCSSSAFPQTRRSLQSLNATLERFLSDPLKEESARDILSTNFFDNVALAKNGDEVFQQFCKTNRLCCMIRSHSIGKLDSSGHSLPLGKTFYFNHKAISLQSGSSLANSATSTLALVTRNHIRLLRVDTSLRY